MDRFDGTAARQLLLIDENDQGDTPVQWRQALKPRPASMRMLRKDVYAELARRRRRAQITARHIIDQGKD
jgi:hypothetical protein